MSFDGVFLHQLMKELKSLKSGRITKIVDSGQNDFILTIRVSHQNLQLLLSFSSDYSRIHLAKRKYDTPQKPKSITMLLRKHIEGFFIEDIWQHHNDRIVCMKLSGYNEMKDQTIYYLICEIMGRYSNLILTDVNYKIIEVLKHDGVSEFARTMLPNATYQFLETEKLNPFTIDENTQLAHSPKELCNQLEGISMLLAQYIFHNDQTNANLSSALSLDIQPAIIKNEKGKKDFYFHPLNYPVLKSYSSLSELLEEYYFFEDNQAKIKANTNDLESFMKKQIIKNEKKIKKLSSDLLDAEKAEDYRIKGELLLTLSNLKDKTTIVSVFNYYTNETINITLDPKYTLLENSQHFYKKYQKLKSGIHYITEQIKLAENEIEYFQMLLDQLKHSSISDALEMRQELIDNKYLFSKETVQKKIKKPNYLTYLVEDVAISVGKNNLQNEYITHHLSKPNDMWFHVKDASGSHVVIHSTELTEQLIRTAAQLAAYYSPLGQSSSVPVDYTLIRNIKKIPGKKACFVTYTKQKTIYIDPDEKWIESLRIKK